MSARADMPLPGWLERGTAEDRRPMGGSTRPPNTRRVRERTDGMSVRLAALMLTDY